MITVIVPIYNAEKYLRECLDSLVSQTFKDIEVLMVNDGSTDSSEAICQEYADAHKNFILLNKENGGQMSAWIMGVKYAHGDYFGFVDSDDYVAPTMYEEMMSKMEATGADVVMCGRYNLDTVSAVPGVPNLKEYYGKDEMHEIYEIVFPKMNTSFSQARWDKLFKRDIYIDNMEKYCSYIVRTFEDRFIVGPYLFSCNSFAFVPKPLYYWRAIKGSSSRKARPELCDIMEHLYAMQVQMLKDKGFYPKYKDQVEIGKIDIMRSIIERNIGARISFREKWEIASSLLTEENRRIVVSHRDACVGKFGKYIYWVCKLNSKLLMIVLASVFAWMRKKTDSKAF